MEVTDPRQVYRLLILLIFSGLAAASSAVEPNRDAVAPKQTTQLHNPVEQIVGEQRFSATLQPLFTKDASTPTKTAIQPYSRQPDSGQPVEPKHSTIDHITWTNVVGFSNTNRLIPVDTVPNLQPIKPIEGSARPIDPNTFTPQMIRLRDAIRDCYALYKDKLAENVNDRSPWGIMHNIIGYGPSTEVISNGRRGSAIGWLCWNGTCRGQKLFGLRNDNLHPKIGPGVQGHSGQFLAVLAQMGVATDTPILVMGRRFTVADLVKLEQQTCKSDTELTFKLIAFTHYLSSTESWRGEAGEIWSMPRLIREEIERPIIGAACGGTHRLMGLSCAVQQRQQRGEPITGEWLRAKTYIREFHQYAIKLQNDDGSFSTEFFAGRGSSPLPDDRLRTTGHILEWLVYSLPTDELLSPPILNALDYLTGLLRNDPGYDWTVGPRGHALRALALYDQRVFRQAVRSAPNQSEPASSPNQFAYDYEESSQPHRNRTAAGQRAKKVVGTKTSGVQKSPVD